MFSPTCSIQPRNPIFTGTSHGFGINEAGSCWWSGFLATTQLAVLAWELVVVLGVRAETVAHTGRGFLAGLFAGNVFFWKSIVTFVEIDDCSMFCFLK